MAQYFTTVDDALAARTFGNRYVFADIGQTELSITSRADISLSPTMTLQVYAQPFVGTGRYSAFKQFLSPGTFSFLEYGVDTGTISRLDDGTRVVDPDGDGAAKPFPLYDGDYNARTLQTKTIFRWEWRPGSVVYLAWTQVHDAGASADNVFLMKVSWWISPRLPARPSAR